MNLFAYNIGTQSVNELDKYLISDLNGNPSYINSTQSTVDGYTDVSSINNWCMYGELTGLKHSDIKDEINELYLGLSWSNINDIDKKSLSRYFLVDKSKRDEVLTDEEQNDFDHFVLYHHLNNDTEKRMGNYSMLVTPKSIDYKKDVSMRFHPKYTFDDNGWLLECEYFEYLDITTNMYGFRVYNFTSPVLKYEASYMVGMDGYVQSRTINRSWYLVSGTYSTDTKNSTKVYEPLTARSEGRRRRQNLINRLLIDTIGLIIMSSPDLDNVIEAEEDAMILMKEIANGISEYYEYGPKKDSDNNPCKLVSQISLSAYPRLDNWIPNTGDTVSIRMFILGRLDPTGSM